MSELGRLIEPGTLRMERLLPAPIERVWAYLVEPDRRARWLAGGTMGASAGERFELHFDNSRLSGEPPPERFKEHAQVQVEPSRVIRIEPPRLLVIGWSEGDNPSEVMFELQERGAQTQLTLTHRRLDSRADTLSVAGGWHTHLDVLDDVLSERPVRPFWTAYLAREAAYDKLLPR